MPMAAKRCSLVAQLPALGDLDARLHEALRSLDSMPGLKAGCHQTSTSNMRLEWPKSQAPSVLKSCPKCLPGTAPTLLNLAQTVT